MYLSGAMNVRDALGPSSPLYPLTMSSQPAELIRWLLEAQSLLVLEAPIRDPDAEDPAEPYVQMVAGSRPATPRQGGRKAVLGRNADAYAVGHNPLTPSAEQWGAGTTRVTPHSCGGRAAVPSQRPSAPEVAHFDLSTFDPISARAALEQQSMAAEQQASIGSFQQQDFVAPVDRNLARLASPRRPSTACSAASFSSQFSHMHQQAHSTNSNPSPSPAGARCRRLQS